MSWPTGKISPTSRFDRGLMLFLIALFILECSGFMLWFLPSAFLNHSNYNAKTPSALLILFGVAGLILKRKIVFRVAEMPFLLPVFLLSILGIVTVTVSCRVYGDANLIDFAKKGLPIIFIPWAYFLFHGLVEDEKRYEYFLWVGICIPTIYAILSILQSIIYPYGIIIFNLDYMYLTERNDRVRLIMTGDIVAFAAVLSLSLFFKYHDIKHKIVAGICAVICVTEVIFVAQTRFLVLALMAVFAVQIFMTIRADRKCLVALAVFLFVLIIFFGGKILDQFIPSSDSFSMTARIGAYSYYLEHVLDNGLIGIGYITDSSGYHYIIEMVYDRVNPRGDITDIGLVGYIARYGVLGIAVLIVFLFVFIREAASFFSKTKRANPEDSIESWSLFLFYLLIAPVMALSDSQRVFFIPMLLLMIDHSVRWNRLRNIKTHIDEVNMIER